ncbi:putative lipid II flippase FtsW [bacterium]|nr:putative lipid II flippase FtsW [bacterium]
MIRSDSLINGSLIVIMLALVLLGLVMVLSSSQFRLLSNPDANVFLFMGGQINRFSIGLACFAYFATTDYNKWERWARPIMILNLILLALVLTPLGDTAKGAQRWLNIGFRFQPSDITKLAVIFYLSSVWAERRDQLGSFFRGVFFPLLLVAFTLGLILLQPDHGTVFFIGVVAISIWFCVGGKLMHMVPGAIAFAAAIGAALYAKPVLWQRITAFMEPEKYATTKYYQVLQAKIGFAHGGLTGAGIGEGVQQLGFMPESHTDFIFAIIGEELGFINCSIIVAAFLLIVLIGYWIAIRCENPFGALLCVGCSTAIGFQSALNIAVVTGSVPTTGIALPFISYGGSALIINMIMVGLMVSVARETFDIEPAARPRSKRAK